MLLRKNINRKNKVKAVQVYLILKRTAFKIFFVLNVIVSEWEMHFVDLNNASSPLCLENTQVLELG